MLLRVDLGSGIQGAPPGYVSSDKCLAHKPDVLFDMEQDWPFKDDSVDEYRAVNVLEHCHDIIHVMNEVWRTLRLGGRIAIQVPSTTGMGAFMDPTHRSFWNLGTLLYFSKEAFSKQYPEIKARFKVWQAVEVMGFQEGVGHIPYVNAVLEKIANGS